VVDHRLSPARLVLIAFDAPDCRRWQVFGGDFEPDGMIVASFAFSPRIPAGISQRCLRLGAKARHSKAFQAGVAMPGGDRISDRVEPVQFGLGIGWSEVSVLNPGTECHYRSLVHPPPGIQPAPMETVYG
jgi:hypothetical protein